MNIAVFIKRTTLHAGYGGLETQNEVLCEGLASRGHKVTVFSPKYELNQDFVQKNGVNYQFVDCVYRSLAGFGALQKNNWENKSYLAFLKVSEKEKYDVILAQSSAGLGIIKNKSKLEIPVISISHGTTAGEYQTLQQSVRTLGDLVRMIPNTGYFLLNFFRRQRQFILKSDKVIAVSYVVKKALIDETYILEDKVEVIHNGVDQTKIKTKDYSVKKDKIQLLYSSQVITSKGIMDLLKALTYPDLSEVTLEVLAGGEELEFYKKYTENLGLHDRVKFVEKLPYSEYLNHICESDLFVLPSKRVEGFPMAVPEAMFAGLPVIGSDLGGTKEGISDEKTGFVYKSGDIDALISAILRFVKNPELLEKMGRAGLEKAKSEFSLDAMLIKYEKVMSEVISS